MQSKINLSTIFLISLSILIIASGVSYYAFKAGEREVSEKLLHAFYTFDLQTISENDALIKKLTTNEIYEQFTISSSNRQLRVYLKFEGNPTKANIISHKGNTIFYNIVSEGFDPERTFAIQYKYRWGKIVKLIEYEVFFLPQSSRSDLSD